MIGRRIYWKGVNRIESGIIADEEGGCWLVLLDNGKHMIVNRRSIIE